MSSGTGDARRTKLDQVVDDVLHEMVEGEPEPALRAKVLARIASDSSSEDGRAGWRGWLARPWLAPGTALAGATLVLLLAVGLWRLAGPGGDQVGRVAKGPEVASGGQPAEKGATRAALTPAVAPAAAGPSAGGLVLARAGVTRTTTVAQRIDAASDESATEVDDPLRVSVPLLRFDPVAEPEAVAVAPIELNEITLEDIQIRPIEVAPLDPGRTSSTGREGTVEERR